MSRRDWPASRRIATTLAEFFGLASIFGLLLSALIVAGCAPRPSASERQARDACELEAQAVAGGIGFLDALNARAAKRDACLARHGLR